MPVKDSFWSMPWVLFVQHSGKIEHDTAGLTAFGQEATRDNAKTFFCDG